MLLRSCGYEVVAILGYAESLKACRKGNFDLFILGHSIPHAEKLRPIRSR